VRRILKIHDVDFKCVIIESITWKESKIIKIAY